jgi:Osmosensitive K+ channel histidine kinase
MLKNKEKQKQILSGIIITMSILIISFILCEVLDQFKVSEQIISVIMVLAIFVISIVTDGYIYGLSASFVGALTFDYLFIEPRLILNFVPEFLITLLIMLIVTFTISITVGKIKKQLSLAREKEYHAEILYGINRKFLSSRDEYSIARYAVGYLSETIKSTVALYLISSDGEISDFYISQAENDASAETLSSESIKEKIYNVVDHKISVTSDSLYYVPIITQDNVVYGVFIIACEYENLSDSDTSLLSILSDQTAQAIRIYRLTARQQEIMIAAETEKVRNSFLRGISHDLRTPLTSILGASATILEGQAELSADKQKHLIKGIQEDSQWLLSMVENILLITRIHENDMTIEKSEEVAEEVVSEAVALFRNRFPDVNITIRSTDELLFVLMDALLITQIINNLLYNSQRHSGVKDLKISIVIQEKDGYAEFIISDNGVGVNNEILPKLFETQPIKDRNIVDSSRGLRIGLSICKTIAEVHGGWIKARNLPDSGAEFTFAIPMGDDTDGK